MTPIVVRDEAGDLTDRFSLNEKAMNSLTDLALRIKNRIARRTERIARWDREADQVEASWTGGPEYRKFCEAMAGATREKKAELEAELKQLQGLQGNGKAISHETASCYSIKSRTAAAQ